jgi:hypothetical protein
MSNERNYFKYGEIIFRDSTKINDILVNYTIIPNGYLVQEENDPKKIYVFKTYKDIEIYFEGKKYE